VRYAADVLNGVPSIVIGVTVYGLVVIPMGHFSTLAGGLALGLIMIPVTLRTTEEFLRLVPDALRDASLALGAPRWVTIVHVVIPAGARGILAGVLLSMARVAGETAPLLFTAFSNRYWSEGWMQPTASLPVMIFTYAVAPYEDWHRQAWTAALVLLALVLGSNVLARLALQRGGRLRRAA
jgi:phosphate transport system permease protein